MLRRRYFCGNECEYEMFFHVSVLQDYYAEGWETSFLGNSRDLKNYRASWYSWFFLQKLALGLLREFLYSKETLENWPKGTFTAQYAKE